MRKQTFLTIASSIMSASLTACSGYSSLVGGSMSLSSQGLRAGQSNTIKIMPLGDSITFGYSGQDPTASQGGYRTRLYNLLNQTGNYTFVGTQSSGPASLADNANEGHSGWRIDEIAAGVDGWIAQNQPDQIILHIGTNDFVQGKGQDAQYRLSLLIDQITADAPNAKLFVASIIPLNLSGSYNSDINYYNTNLQAIVSTKANVEGKNVVFVDMNSAVSSYAYSPDYDSDGIHPSQIGYEKMADRWATALISANSATSATQSTGSAAADITSEPSDLAGRATVVVNRYVNSSGNHIFARADAAGAPGSGYTLEGAAFNLYTSQYESTIAIYKCKFGNHQFLSSDSTCEGQTIVNRMGYVSESQVEGTSALYRMRNANSDYIEANEQSPLSAGYVLEGVLGYTP